MFENHKSPLKIIYQKSRIEQVHTLIINPNKIKVGEVAIIQAPKFFGLIRRDYAVLNVDGKRIKIQELK
jgi:hypothetical protein